MHKKLPLIAATLALSVGMAACGDKKAGTDGNAASSVTTGASAKDTGDAAKAVNAYVKAHNELTGMFYGLHKGRETLLKVYKAQNLGQSKTVRNPRLYLSVSRVRNAVESLEEAQAIKMGAKYAKLEEVGARMLPNAKELLKQAQTLEAYINSKKYLEDGFAVFQAENDSFVKRWEQFNADAQALGDQLDVVERERRMDDIQAYEKAGNMLGMYREQSLLLASEVLGLVDGSDDLKNAEKIKIIDAKIAELEATLAKLKTEMDKSPEAASKQRVATVYDRLNQFIGHWRELKVKQNASAFDNMISAYNGAIR